MKGWKMKRNVGVLTVLVLGVILLFASSAHSEALRWQAPTTWTDDTPISSADAATITYYVRLDKPNPRDTTGTSGWYYLGETRSGGLFYPADNSLASLMRSFGFSGQAVKFTVSAAFTGTDGVERDSVPSPPYPPTGWTVPPEQLVQVAMPSVSPAYGTYATSQSVTLATTTAGASIRYTTDLSTPSSTAGTLYSTPITVGVGTTTLRAIAYKTGMADSLVSSGGYIVTPPPVVPKTPAVPKFTVIR
jgi:hypothetical protein